MNIGPSAQGGIVPIQEEYLKLLGRWMDSGESLEFEQADGKLTVKCTGYPYGTDFCVRVAKATVKA
ncbi:MAG: hypothetical protein IJY39_07825 [Clostridia bacterium]|nr:hypothetical protein [Clostridia bacterium]